MIPLSTKFLKLPFLEGTNNTFDLDQVIVLIFELDSGLFMDFVLSCLLFVY